MKGARTRPGIPLIASALVVAASLASPLAAEAYTRNFYWQATANSNSVKYAGYNNQYGSRINTAQTYDTTVVAREWNGSVFTGQSESVSGATEFTHPNLSNSQAQCYYRSNTWGSLYTQCSWLS